MQTDSNPGESDGELPAECQAARSAMAEFVGSNQAKDGSAGFREHLTQCEECMVVYRQTMSAAARLGRSIREDRGDDERRWRKSAMATRAKKATAEPGRRNRFALRLALLPAAFALLIFLQRALKPGEGLTVHWKGGEVHVGSQRLNKEFPKRVLNEKGLYCYTKGNAHAQIFSHTDSERERFDLGIQSTLLVTDPENLEVRLEIGELLIYGEARVLSQYGLVEVEEGHAKLTIRDLKFQLECLEGSLSFITPAGEETLNAGEVIERGG